MKVLGIVAEYNPFHNGHLYQFNTAKELVKPDYSVAVMSGNFLQRGEPALFDKYTRTKMALYGGLDAIFELPAYYALSSADEFAAAAVITLSKVGVTHISFGVETEHFEDLVAIAKFSVSEPEDFQVHLKSMLKEGLSYPKAYAMSIAKFLGTEIDESVLSTPNNMLAIGYLKAIYKYCPEMIPVPVTRKEAAYHDNHIHGDICSATAIRNTIMQMQSFTTEDKSDVNNALIGAIPTSTFNLMPIENELIQGMFLDDFAKDMQYVMLTSTYAELINTYDISSELANRITNTDLTCVTTDEFYQGLLSKQYTSTRIQRACMHRLLQMTQDEFANLKAHNYIFYVRLLGVRKNALSYLKEARAHCDVPFIQKTSEGKKELQATSTQGFLLFQKDILTSDLYRMHWFQKYGITLPSDYQQNAIIET